MPNRCKVLTSLAGEVKSPIQGEDIAVWLIEVMEEFNVCPSKVTGVVTANDSQCCECIDNMEGRAWN